MIMQCREVRDLLDSFLGEELLIETNHGLMRHLESCPDCRAELDARRQLRGVLRGAFNRTDSLAPSPDFAATALQRVRERAPRPTIWSRGSTWGALAAVLVLAVASALLLSGNRPTLVARDAVGDHRNCAIKFALAERPISLADAAAQYDPIYARLETTPPDQLAGVGTVAARHSCVFNGRRFGHVVLQAQGHLVSVLVTRDERAQAAGPGPAEPSWLQPLDDQNVAVFSTPGHAVFIVSDLPDAAFRDVARTLKGAVAERLAALLGNIPAGIGD
jgi:anti-sigma factor RsiW